MACYAQVSSLLHFGPRTVLVDCAVCHLVFFLITRPIAFHFQHPFAAPGKRKTMSFLIHMAHGTRKTSPLQDGSPRVSDADRVRICQRPRRSSATATTFRTAKRVFRTDRARMPAVGRLLSSGLSPCRALGSDLESSFILTFRVCAVW